MTSCAEGHHTAFVIMPFGAEFDAIYESFFKPVLTDVGFEVRRADELRNAGSIMGAIIRQLKDSCIIVADLSDSNPNVYYELGLAHAMHKPVISLSQHVEELPFDIRPYRAIRYGVRAVEKEKAAKELVRVAQGVFDGTTTFGNPFSSYTAQSVTPTCSVNSPVDGLQSNEKQPNDDDGQMGILDRRVEIEDGLEKIRVSAETIGERTEQIGNSMRTTTDRLNTTLRAGGSQAREQRKLVQALAAEMNGYARFLSGANDDYGETVEHTRPALEAAFDAVELSNNEEVKDLRNLLSVLDDVQGVAAEAQRGTDDFASTIGGLPDIEKSFTRARDQVVVQLHRLSGNFDLMLSMIARVREMAQAKLGESSGQA